MSERAKRSKGQFAPFHKLGQLAIAGCMVAGVLAYAPGPAAAQPVPFPTAAGSGFFRYDGTTLELDTSTVVSLILYSPTESATFPWDDPVIDAVLQLTGVTQISDSYAFTDGGLSLTTPAGDVVMKADIVDVVLSPTGPHTGTINDGLSAINLENVTVSQPTGESSRFIADWMTASEGSGLGAIGLTLTNTDSGSIDPLVAPASGSALFALQPARLEFCGNGICGAEEDQCSCPADCGPAPSSETGSCTDDIDNDCDTFTDCDDSDCSGDLACICDDDGICEWGEDCTTCPDDCMTGSGAVCGNGVCEAGDGEDCMSCPADCKGKQRGKPSRWFCCGGNGGINPVGCDDGRCTTDGWECTDVPVVPSCCGDGACDGIEDGFNCEIDCGPPPCGDGICDPLIGEDACNCSADCGDPPEAETSCTNDVDDDCDGRADCADTDCVDDPSCLCLARGEACTLDSDCCSGRCHSIKGTCK